MSQIRLQRAQSLIKAGNYDEAYVILQKVDHPTARKWLQQIDAIQRERQQQESHDTEELEESLNSVFTSIPKDSTKSAESKNISAPIITEKVKVNANRYSAVRFIAGAYIFLGVFVGGIGVAIGVMTLLGGGYYASSGFVNILISLITGLSLVAAGQVIQMIIEFVENSRTQIRILQRIADSLENK
jgi:hypothetical protein